MLEALKVIIEKSPAALMEAAGCIRAIHVGSPVVQERFNRVAELALGDPDAEFTPDERTLIASFVEVDEPDAVRDLVLRVRVNAAEKAAVQGRAVEAGQTLSDYVRERVGLS